MFCGGLSDANSAETPLCAWLEGNVDGLAVFCRQRHLLILLSELFMHEGNRVVPWRQTLDFKVAVRTSDSIKRALDHVHKHAHPGMLVALYRQQNFLPGECLFDCRGLRGLRLIPLAIVFGSWVYVVRRGIAVDDGDGLSSHHAEDVGFVFATALRESDRCFRNVESAVAKAFLYIDENVLEMASAYDEVLGGI